MRAWLLIQVLVGLAVTTGTLVALILALSSLTRRYAFAVTMRTGLLVQVGLASTAIAVTAGALHSLILCLSTLIGIGASGKDTTNQPDGEDSGEYSN